ncbi:hypothetical protein FIU97_03165 [Roseivivax sp. THAF40]|uniref:imm11 family protein n=1 Tax=Roseivivax sp. THAF40 TaxID=2587858 RepID=UPI0012685A9E|nr:DUF1629 domain-containing protein [Roseivivax sp. THAF40]QFT45567.1 hypothetical protein FIU97_03165 [Roseivivax sp. THAF40]
MAIVLDREWGGRFYDTYTLECATEANIEATTRLRDQQKAWKREDRKRVMAQGKHPFWHSAIERPIPEHLMVKQLKLTKGDDLPDYIHHSPAGHLVSDRLKALIEEEEPAGQGFQFFAVEIKTKSGEPYGTPYWHWDVFRRIDAIDPSSEALESVSGPVDGNHRWSFKSAPKPWTKEHLILSKPKIEGMAAWVDFRFDRGYPFLSDSLHEKTIAAQITGFSAQSVWSER